MKKNRICTIILAIVVCIAMLSTTAFAEEQPKATDEVIGTYDFEISPSENGGTVSLMSTSNVNDTFNVTGQHTGSSRIYSGNHIRYIITITDSNGNPADNILAVRLCRNGSIKRENQFWANGSTSIIQDIPVESGVPYYFEYLLAYGTVRTLKVHMIIESYNL